MQNNGIDWDNLLDVETISLDDERNTSVVISEYIVNAGYNESFDVDLVDRKKITLRKYINVLKKYNEITLGKSMVEKVSKDYLIGVMNSQEYINVSPNQKFPTTESLENIFEVLTLLSMISKNELDTGYISPVSLDQGLQNIFKNPWDLLETLTYLGFLKKITINNELVFIADIFLYEYKKINENERLLFLICKICNHKTLKEILVLQFFASYDNITKQMIKEKLITDPNISEMQLKNEELSRIESNLRSWYSTIRNHQINYNN